jgi:hypothetical protein
MVGTSTYKDDVKEEKSGWVGRGTDDAIQQVLTLFSRNRRSTP